jgi:hypothetical protein
MIRRRDIGRYLFVRGLTNLVAVVGVFFFFCGGLRFRSSISNASRACKTSILYSDNGCKLGGERNVKDILYQWWLCSRCIVNKCV